MDVEELSMIGPTVDLSSVDSIHRKRITAFVNHFVIQTASFLNRFAKNAEHKLFYVDTRLQKLEAALILLESKLESIPGLNSSSTSLKHENKEITQQSADNNSQTIQVIVQDVAEEDPKSEAVMQVESPQLDDSLLKFVKMLQFGVPLPAVKLKMEQESISSQNQDAVILAHSGK